MTRFDNHVYYSICEKSYEIFMEKTNFQTFSAFCSAFKNSFALMDISQKEIINMMEIRRYIQTIYGFEYTEALEYVIDFFREERYLIFIKSVLFMNEYFKTALN